MRGLYQRFEEKIVGSGIRSGKSHRFLTIFISRYICQFLLRKEITWSGQRRYYNFHNLLYDDAVHQNQVKDSYNLHEAGECEQSFILSQAKAGNSHYQFLRGVYLMNIADAKILHDKHVSNSNGYDTIEANADGHIEGGNKRKIAVEARDQKAMIKSIKYTAQRDRRDRINSMVNVENSIPTKIFNKNSKEQSHRVEETSPNGSVESNEISGVEWLIKAAEQGHSEAMCVLGNIYMKKYQTAPLSASANTYASEAVRWFDNLQI
jgi:hypothetical protein